MPETRRDFLKKFSFEATRLGVLAGAAGFLEFDRETESRTKEVLEKSRILKGESKGVLKIGGKEYSSEQLKNLLPRIVCPKNSLRKQMDSRLSPQEAGEVLKTLGTVIELEDSFGRKINTLPALESADQFLEEKTGRDIPLANSFGLGQINPETAREMVLKYGEGLVASGILTQEVFERLAKHGVKQHEIIKLLDLRGDTNLVYSFLVLFEAYDYYARDIHGRLHSNMEQDPRATNLAISAYSARQSSPLGAKLQTKINEINLCFENSQGHGELLIPDGDTGKKTMKALLEVLEMEKISVDPKIIEDAKKGHIPSLEFLLMTIGRIWEKTGRSVIESATPQDMQELYSRRYRAVNDCYLLLRDEFATSEKEKEKLKKYLDDFIDHRSTTLFDLISNPAIFSLVIKKGSYEQFLSRLRQIWPKIVAFEERYKGYIPLGYKPPSQPGEDPKNVMLRIIQHLDLAKSKSKVN